MSDSNMYLQTVLLLTRATRAPWALKSFHQKFSVSIEIAVLFLMSDVSNAVDV